MSGHLLALTVGPVQEFIAAARRTRDLWFGSHLLSEISRAVAVAVVRHGGLIFPASADAPNVANVIVAELHPEGKPATIAQSAKQAAKDRWREFTEAVFAEYQGVIRRDIWNDQVADVVEFHAAWVPTSGDYQADRGRLMRLLAGRKNCRDFLPAKGRAGVPKSSLDGLRESVLKEPREWRERDRRRMRVRIGEQLDVVGLVKRVAEGTRRYPSVSRVAADPWLQGQEGRLGDIIAACERLNSSQGPQVIRELDIDAHPHYRNFPFEGTAVFRNRYHELTEESDLGLDDLRPLADAVARLGEPNPYLAVLVADGDRMGETISKLASAEEHRRFSAKLAEFAAQAHDIVHTHRGVLVYAGGDDVLAFIPVDQCLDCARALHDTFGELLKEWSEKARTKITLSVGIAIGHFLENLEDLREYGQAAEKHAKTADADGVKNALAVHLHKRGGSPIKVRARWTDSKPPPSCWADALDTRINGMAAMLHLGQLPTRLATDLNQMADVYDGWPQIDEAAKKRVKDAIERDVLRVIAAKQPREGGSVRERLHAALNRVTDAASLRHLAEELLVARQIATACRQAAGRDHGETS
jgi:CRISPR-associated protein Cmr2